MSLSTGEEGELIPAGVIERWEGIEVPFLSGPSRYVEVAPLNEEETTPSFHTLAVPQRYQYPESVTCGAAALGMALEFLSLNGEGVAPSSKVLVDDLKKSGLLYEMGTGVEELAYLAREHGYRGTTAFHDWTLEQLVEQLHLGKPVVVSLGANGAGKPGHFVTLTGISADGKWVSYNDPILGAQTVPVHDFLRSWSLQGNSGLVVQKQPLSTANDPMLPWMGLFGALSTLAVLVRSDPGRSELKETLRAVRSVLADPRRKGLGGALITEGGSSSSPSYTAPPGYKWKKTLIPKYGWKDVEVIEKVEVPNMVRTWAVVKVNRWMEKVPVYKTVKVDRGRWAYRTVTKHRTERYRTSERYRVKKSYWYRRNGRLRRGTRYEWKTRTVVKTRRVPYTKRERYWAPKIVAEQRIDRYRQIEHRDPVYGWREEKRGTRIVNKIKTTRAWAKIGTVIKWELKKDPAPTPTPPNPMPTSTQTTTPWPTVTPSATPSNTLTSTPTETPTSQYDWLYYRTCTPAPAESPNPIEESEFEGKWVGKTLRLVRTAGKMLTSSSVMLKTLESGQISVSAPSLPIGARRDLLQKFGFIGTKYNPSTITNITGKQLVTSALSKATWITAGVTSLIGNVIDYGFGKNKDKGFGQEFAVSTTVDTVMTIGTGFLAAGAVALGTAALGVTLAVPAAIAATVVAGLVIGGLLDAGGVGDYVKEKTNIAVDAVEVGVQNLAQGVVDGVEVWKGVADKAKIIDNVIRERIKDTVGNAANAVINAVNNTIEFVADTIDAAGAAINNTAERINDSIEQTISNTVNSIGNFLGNVFGGGG